MVPGIIVIIPFIYLHLLTEYSDGNPTQINLDYVFHEHIAYLRKVQFQPSIRLSHSLLHSLVNASK